ncbi:hypothetical protein NtRootA9_32710 [Arthrobacter sp. NtRootA9]|nr:hypothetical protein NtRootA9_32710 [Arthrobacter sp. NtRootA9]
MTFTPPQEPTSAEALADALAEEAGAEEDGVAAGVEQAARVNRRPAAELAAAARIVVRVTCQG